MVAAGMMMTLTAFALVCTIPWAVPNQVVEFFEVPQSAITDTDQWTAEHRWVAKKRGETNYDNVDTCLVTV